MLNLISYNVLWLTLLGLTHLLLVSSSFKALISRVLPPQLHKMQYNTKISMSLVMVMMAWRSMNMTLWNSEIVSKEITGYVYTVHYWLMVAAILKIHAKSDIFGAYGISDLWMTVEELEQRKASM